MGELKVAIVTINDDFYSETFIRAHIEQLKGELVVYSGGKFPIYADKVYIKYHKFLASVYLIFYRLFWRIKFSPEELNFLLDLKSRNIAVVLAEYGTVGSRILRVVKFLSIPMIVHFHGFDASEKRILEQNKLKYKEMFQYAKFVISVSSVMTKTLSNCGADSSKIILNPYGPRNHFFQLKGAKKNLTFLAIGRFVSKKAPHLTIFAFKEVLDDFPQAKLIMIGAGGDILDFCIDLVRFLGIQKSVQFEGSLDHNELGLYFENSMAFVQHSRVASTGDSEGMPVAILEAGAAALPVISTNHSGIPECINHEETGFLVEENDYRSMAHWMKYLCANPSIAVEMGAKARGHIHQNFLLQRHLDCIDYLIKKCVNE